MAKNPAKIENPRQGSFAGRMGKPIRSARKGRAPDGGFLYTQEQEGFYIMVILFWVIGLGLAAILELARKKYALYRVTYAYMVLGSLLLILTTAPINSYSDDIFSIAITLFIDGYALYLLFSSLYKLFFFKKWSSTNTTTKQ